MAHFRVEVMEANGKTLYHREFELPCETPEQAMYHPKVKEVIKEAKSQQLGYRIKREE